MSLITGVLVLLAQVAVSSESTAPLPGYRPSGSPVELVDLGLLARLRDPAVQALSFSSYVRTGVNDDSFSGTHSQLRLENGDSVLAEMDGPGIIQRIWFTHASGEKRGLLEHQNDHMKIYFYGQEQPVLDLPLELIFTGAHRHFPRPLVGEGSGGFVSYVPIAFQKGCKVVVQGRGVRPYQIDLLRLPADARVSSFSEQPSPDDETALKRAVAIWSDTGSYETRELAGADVARYELEGLGNSVHEYALRPGPAVIRSLEVAPAENTEKAWKKARLRIAWDTDLIESAAVDMPLGLFFGCIEGADSYQSMLVGQRAGTWYNRFPMPYHRQTLLQIATDEPLKGTLVVRTVREVPTDAAFFHAGFRAADLTRPKEDFNWLSDEGRGHFAGVLLLTEGKAKLLTWLEGDDRFKIDGRLAIHGTGSEGYFNCGWYAVPGRLDRPACYPLHGFPVFRQQGETWQAAAYRWHLGDPVPYARTIMAGIEYGGENSTAASYRAAVFWYSQRPGPLQLGAPRSRAE
jgi:hypothetical protein